jgi:hypothetical protein
LAAQGHEYYWADFLKRWLVLARATVVIPLHKRVVFVRFLNCPEFSSRLAKISQAHNTITGIQFRIGSGGLDERRLLGGLRPQLLRRVTKAVVELCAVSVSIY